MASGNHVCKPNCADFPTAALLRQSPIISNDCIDHSSDVNIKSATGNTIPKSLDRTTAKISAIPANINTSPTRLTTIALIAALFAKARVNQKLISIKLIIPTPSHPTNITRKLLAVTIINIKNANIDKYIKNRTTYGSSPM